MCAQITMLHRRIHSSTSPSCCHRHYSHKSAFLFDSATDIAIDVFCSKAKRKIKTREYEFRWWCVFAVARANERVEREREQKKR